MFVQPCSAPGLKSVGGQVPAQRLNCLSMNARSIVNKRNEFLVELNSYCYDLIFVVETWLHEFLPDSLLVENSGYCLCRRDRGSRGGGILVAIRESIRWSLIRSSHDIEVMRILLVDHEINLILGYIPDGYNENDVLSMCAFFRDNLHPTYTNIILGDFNQSSINWHDFSATNCIHQKFMDHSFELGLTQLVPEPTRGHAILDLVFVDNDRTVFGVNVCENFGTSDHNSVTFQIQPNVSSILNPHKSTNSRRIDFTGLRAFLNSANWSQVTNALDVDVAWNGFITIINEGISCHSSTYPQRPHKPRVPLILRKLKRKKLALWHRWHTHPSFENKVRYLTIKKSYTSKVNDLANAEEHRVIREGNLSALFKFMKRKTRNVRSIPPLKADGNLIIDDLSKANVLVDMFSQNFVIDNGNIPSLPQINYNSACSAVIFNPFLVEKILRSMKSSNSVGPDGFSSTFYKEIANIICHPLSAIFNLSFSCGKLPAAWKTARVIPIYKKGDAADPANYRPIALTCIPCKAMERIVRDCMLSFIEKYQIIDSNQFGFLPHRSTVLQLLAVMEEWTRSIDLGIPVDVVFVDFAKAFESVVHQKLLTKLEHYGFTGPLLKWIEDFLINRTHHVVVGSNTSHNRRVVSGVPQGSVLGPLLFIIYINDLNCSSNSSLHKFADDVKTHGHARDNRDHANLQTSLNYLHDWSENWQLPINADKCAVLHIGRKNHQNSFTMASSTLKPKTLVKDLGVWFSADLKFSTHCSNIVRSANQRLALIRRCFTSGDPLTLIKAYKVYVRPILEYASQVWSPHLVKDITKLEGVQRRFTRFLRGYRELCYKDRLLRAKLDSLELRRLKADLVLTFLIIRNIVNFDLTHFFKLRGASITRGHNYKLLVVGARLDCRKFFYANRVVAAWNSLPTDIVYASSVTGFRQRLNKLDLSKFLQCF